MDTSILVEKTNCRLFIFSLWLKVLNMWEEKHFVFLTRFNI